MKVICSEQEEELKKKTQEIENLKKNINIKCSQDKNLKNEVENVEEKKKIEIEKDPKVKKIETFLLSIGSDTIHKVLSVENDKLKEFKDIVLQKLNEAELKVVALESELSKKKFKLQNVNNETKVSNQSSDLLKEKLELTKDENKNLKITLNSINQEKIKQIKIFENLLTEMKLIFKTDLEKILNLFNVNNTEKFKNNLVDLQAEESISKFRSGESSRLVLPSAV
ncbi:hypothetical protein HK099_001054 [Clydaea vesicula]|uniref:Uncharacterized protein n=1 Tax=Clydaea vesicula TaxID=447962 RepID=A0AAD5TYS9_9FUNG|nr:hypothetical protein HK099_001054 [Clydaea vesicula]